MLDCSPARILQKAEKFKVEFWQLRTPLTKYARAPVPYGLDNGCFKTFRRNAWLRLIEEAHSDRPKFVCLPDVVGDAQRTAELFEHFADDLSELPRALVLQDGIERVTIPWKQISAVFIGGSDAFKFSPQAIRAAQTAKMLGKWVHVGRVNTADRVRNWLGIADSIDGSGISQYDHMLTEVLDAMNRDQNRPVQMDLDPSGLLGEDVDEVRS